MSGLPFLRAHGANPAGARARGKKDSRVWLFHRLFALCLLLAWCSLGSQVLLLVGEQGLLAFAPVLQRVGEVGLSFWQLPSVFRWGASDAWLVGGCWVGAGLAVFACFGVLPRVMFACSVLLYFSYAEIAGPFLAFQWDNLLLEAGFLATIGAVVVPARKDAVRPVTRALARMSGGAWSVLLLRVLLFKLYFESGLAKLQSPAGDWLAGSAMQVYYETAPLPGPLAWHAHGLPAWFHRLESWATLGLELLVPLLCFGPRRARHTAFAALTLFQCFNVATANYGFFSYLSVALHVVLFDHVELRDFAAAWVRRGRRFGAGRVLTRAARVFSRRVERGGRSLCHVVARVSAPLRGVSQRRAQLQPWLVTALAGLYLLVSLHQGVQRFGDSRFRVWGLAALDDRISALRLINTYHLFAQITLERIEPVFAVFSHGQWTELSFLYKPGPLQRPLPLVAPHQPRVDFSLWFYGLRFRGAPPPYVKVLLHDLCADSGGIAPLFVEPLPTDVERVRLSFWQYHFTTPEQRGRTGQLWTRQELSGGRTTNCDRSR
jgi:lipase maturation factor 1